jgi:hypothetical protein
MKIMNIESQELKEYIKSVVSSVSEGITDGGFRIIEPIEFDLAVTNTTEGSGGLKIYVAKAEGKLKSEEISHIKFKATPNTKVQINYPSNRRSGFQYQ